MSGVATGTWRDVLDAPGAARGEAPWLARLRAGAAAAFRASGFPTRKDEDWRHTDVRAVARGAFEPAPGAAGRAHEGAGALLPTPGTLADLPRRVLLNGRWEPALGEEEALGEGVEVTSLARALAEGALDLEERLGRRVDGTGHAFEALNTALFEDGVVVRVRAGAEPGRPLHLVFLALGGARPTAVHPRVLLVLEAGARLGLVETWTGRADAPWLSNVVVEAFLGPNARLDLLEIQDQPRSALHFRTLAARLDRDASFTATCLSLGAGLARNDVHVVLDGPGAACRLDGLTLVEGEQHADHVTRIDHARPYGTSHQLYKGILDGRATTAFAGRVVVEPHAQKTDARQANHNLLLSPDAVADSKPQLEIFADDVKCAHGATVGQLDESAIFYLRSRGLGLDAARRLLIRAFAAEVPERIEDETLRACAQASLERRLPGGD